jgi:hypothetical protein
MVGRGELTEAAWRVIALLLPASGRRDLGQIPMATYFGVRTW